MKNYVNFMTWAIVYFVDRTTQDDKKDKLQVEALFRSKVQAEDNYIIRNNVKRYIVSIDDLEQFEKFYNLLNDKGLKPRDCWTIELDGFTQSEKQKYLSLLSS